MAELDREDHTPELAWKLAKRTSLVTVAIMLVFAYLLAGAPPWSMFEDSSSEGLERVGLTLLMLAAGALGGCLYNFRALTKHMQNHDFYPRFELSYILRPFAGALCGLFVFALVYGGVLTLTLGQQSPHIDSRSVILYVAISLLAGFGSHEFLRKVKDINRTIFALSEDEARKEELEGKAGGGRRRRLTLMRPPVVKGKKPH